jgi:hypothetical protein
MGYITPTCLYAGDGGSTDHEPELRYDSWGEEFPVTFPFRDSEGKEHLFRLCKKCGSMYKEIWEN